MKKIETERDYWICQLAGWGSLAAMAMLTTNAGDTGFYLAKMFCIFTGLGLSHLWRLYLRHHGWLHHSGAIPLKTVLAALAVVVVLQSAMLFLSDWIFRDGQVLADPNDRVSVIVGIAFLWSVVFAAWTLCYMVALARRRAQRFELEKLELEVSIKDAELRALQAQVNPHFFFNSLNSIRSLIYQDQDAAALAVSQLAGMMRHSLQGSQADTVRLADELAAVAAYLGMEKLRFEDRLNLSMDIAPGLDDIAMAPMALQTLVENAVKHGVELSMGVCRVMICARRDEQTVLLSVANEGRLNQASESTRLGLQNTGKRLALLFGPLATCSLAEHNGWVTASIVLPQTLPQVQP